MGPLHTATATGFALVAFAANSVLGRAAPDESVIDAASVSTIRLTSGAVALVILSWLVRERGAPVLGGDWGSAAMVQLAVLVAAAAGGVVFLAEPVSLRLVVASVVILGGVAVAVWSWSAGESMRVR